MTDKEAFAFLKENLSDEAKAAMDELLKQEQNIYKKITKRKIERKKIIHRYNLGEHNT